MKKRYILLFFFAMLFGALIAVVAVVFGPQLYYSVVKPPEPEPPEPIVDPDMQRYFDLKKTSCDMFSKNFLIVTEDVAHGEMQGLIPATSDEQQIADSIIRQYDFNQTTRTYLRGDQMKKAVLSNETETITIWKEGRVYVCEETCSMRLMSENESEEYYDMLYRIRNDCAYFGKTDVN